MANVDIAQRPDRLAAGDEVRVVAPSWSLAMISKDVQQLATERFEGMGLQLTFGAHVNELDQFMSSSIESRVADLHAAFADSNVRAVFAVIGGYNANQLLPYLDWDLIGSNPKIFCGFSDITALNTAMYERSNLITYSGPAYSTFGMRDHFALTDYWCRQVLFDGGTIAPEPAEHWTDDDWFLDQDDRQVRDTDGWWPMQQGRGAGPLVGGNLCTLNLLQGTPYMANLAGHILAIEDDHESSIGVFDRDLTSLTQLPGFDELRGLMIGRFQASMGMSRRKLAAILHSKRELRDVPVIANMDFGHTTPIMTLPIGGPCTIDVTSESAHLAFEA